MHIVEGKPENRALLGDLPFPVISVAAKHQHTLCFHRLAVCLEGIPVAQPEPLANGMGRLSWVFLGKVRRTRERPISVVQVFAEAQIHIPLLLHPLDQSLDPCR